MFGKYIGISLARLLTTTNITVFADYINSAFNDYQQVDTVYTVFREAFDKVYFNIFVFKLRSQYGFSDHLTR